LVRGFTFFRIAYFLSTMIALLLCASFSSAQQGGGSAPPGRNQPRPNSAPPQQIPQGDAKRMELEERRRLRQEIQRHGPDFRSKEVARPVQNTLAAPALPPPASVPTAPSPTQPPPLPPLPSYFGSPVLPASNPSPGISRGPAMSQEERQQLRQQIRDERKRGLYPTPSEVDR
jgi:hypothetical protein